MTSNRSDLRNSIQELVNSLQALDPTEKKHKEFTLDWIRSGAKLFRENKPATPSPHLVSYFLPFDEKENKILLVDHKKAKLWLPPGGHVEINEHPKDTVIREVQEELFTEANFFSEEPLFLSVNQTSSEFNRHIDISLWYVLKGDSRVNYTFDESEFYKIEWFDLKNISYEESEPHLKRFLTKFLSLQSA